MYVCVCVKLGATAPFSCGSSRNHWARVTAPARGNQIISMLRFPARSFPCLKIYGQRGKKYGEGVGRSTTKTVGQLCSLFGLSQSPC